MAIAQPGPSSVSPGQRQGAEAQTEQPGMESAPISDGTKLELFK